MTIVLSMQMHKDKETPPLLAFPWFGAQFLSHSFLALERDSRFSQITRYNAQRLQIISYRSSNKNQGRIHLHIDS